MLLREISYFDLLYSNSMCKQSSMPTSILMELLLSGGILKECTQMSFSLFTSAIRLDIETRMKYLRPSLRNLVRHDVEPCLPEFHVDALVAFVLLLYVLEQEVERLCLPHLPWCGNLLGEGQKFMMVTPVVEEFCGCG